MDDLTDTGRLLALHDQAVERELVPAGEHGRLQWVMAAERALRLGERNPCGMFAGFVRRGMLRQGEFAFYAAVDEEAAHQRIKAHLYGDDRSHTDDEEQSTVAKVDQATRRKQLDWILRELRAVKALGLSAPELAQIATKDARSGRTIEPAEMIGPLNELAAKGLVRPGGARRFNGDGPPWSVWVAVS